MMFLLIVTVNYCSECCLRNFILKITTHSVIITDLEDTSMCSASTSSSGSYSGVPYFVQTLKNVTVKEGDPVRFDANINANPHPKVCKLILKFEWLNKTSCFCNHISVNYNQKIP